MVDLNEYARRAIANPVTGPPELDVLERLATRHRHKRFTWRLVVAGAVAVVTVLGLLAVTRQTNPQVVTTNGAAAPRGWSTYRDDTNGLSISYPASWQPAKSTVTPVLVDPVVPIALGTYRLEPQRLGECDIVPQRALEALGSRDAFIAVYVFRGMATWGADASRPVHFGPQLPWFRSPLQCTEGVRGRVGSVNFADHGLHLSVLIAFGSRDTPQRRQELYRILDTLSVKPRAP